jgi:hypothetical protein
LSPIRSAEEVLIVFLVRPVGLRLSDHDRPPGRL